MTIKFPARLTLLTLICLTLLGPAMAAGVHKYHLSDVQKITIANLQTLQASGTTIVFIDTRGSGQWQYARDKIPGAIRVTTQDALKKLINEVPPDTEIVTYCT